MKQEFSFNRVFEKIRNLKDPLFVFFFVTLGLGITYTTGVLAKTITGKSINEGFTPFDSTFEEFFTVIIIAPFLETFLFQYLPFKLTQKWMHPILSILFCGLIFGIPHIYNWFYMLSAVVIGLLLGSAYYLRINTGRAFLIVTIIHLLNNCVVFGINHI